MKFALKWVAVFAAYLALTVALYFIDPRFAQAQGATNAVICILFAILSVALAIWSGWDARRFYRRGLEHFEEASMAWVNAAHGAYRQEPAERGVHIVCRCNERIGVLPHDPTMEEVTVLTDAHAKEKLLEVKAVVKVQRQVLDELTGEEVKHDSAV